MPPAPAENPDWAAKPYRVLYLRYDKIGDMILSTSLINAIAASHPTITLDVLASPANAPVLTGNPSVNSVLIWDKSKPSKYAQLVRELRREGYDAVIDCMILAPSTTTLLLMLASGARHRIGVGGGINDFALTLKVPASKTAVHHIEHAAVLATAFGVKTESVDWKPRLSLSSAEVERAEQVWKAQDSESRRRRRLVINISAGRPARRWPDERFIELLAHVRSSATRLNILLICAPADVERAERIAEESGVPRAPTPALRDALALVETTDMVVTPDTSIAHAASACGKPAVILFERGSERLWGGYGIGGRNVVSAEMSLATLPVEPVIDAVDELINTDWDAEATIGGKERRGEDR
ncbi:MAG: glycosyltransferase family 9 protein [Gemmatimonadales bacterium]